ncbi:carbon-nitrogen family hydrolase [Aerococcaceae bacterium 50-4]
MKIAIVQPALQQSQVQENFQMIQALMEEAAFNQPDVIVLPELWNTSFLPTDVKDHADHDGKVSRQFLSQFAKEYQVNVVGGSVANIRGNDLFNTAYVYDRKGQEIAAYDKAHLFSPAKEHTYFKAGETSVTFELDGVKCGIVTCYDLRFPEWVRALALADAQIIFAPAAWPEIRNLHWDTLGRARAIENQFFLVSANSRGPINDEGALYGGHSAIIDPWGEYVVTPDLEVGIKYGNIDLSVIEGIRNSINVFNDRRPEIYDL